jgi:hypothetical protein
MRCERLLAYLPDLEVVGSLDPAGENLWRSSFGQAEGKKYRLCENYSKESVCNWAVPAEDPDPLCRSCRLTQVIPDLTRPGYKEAWYKLESAKRRLVYSLVTLGCPIKSKSDDPEGGLAYRFLADPETPGADPVFTGHANGVITLNLAEADDAERERRRQQLHEPYRTLLGHFRHEAGHYYWEKLIRKSPRIDPFRKLFGDEQQEYGPSLRSYYNQGPPADWQQRFVSAYAGAHPWEDWAETWAHYLHITDTLETAAACGLSLRPRRPDEPALKAAPAPDKPGSFDQLIGSWFPLTYLLNNLNRGLGLPDGYPFVLSTPAIDKLRFVHETIRATSVTAIHRSSLSSSVAFHTKM